MNKARKSKLNVKLLRRIQKHILEEPKRFFMEWYVAYGKPGGRTGRIFDDMAAYYPSCGTAACIAGWTNIFTGAKPEFVPKSERARKKLGLKTGDSITLFNAYCWPEPFAYQYGIARTPAKRAKIAAARIEHLIQTGE